MSPLGSVQLGTLFYERVKSWEAPSVKADCGDICIVHNTSENKVRIYAHSDTEWVALAKEEVFDASWKDILLSGDGGDMTKAVYDPDEDGLIAEAQTELNYPTHSNANDHSHSNKTILDAIQEAFTTALKTSYDWLVTNITSVWKTTTDNFVASKGQVSGLAPLDTASKVPTVNLGGVGADNTKYLRGDQTWQVPAGGGTLPTPICIELWQDAALTAWTNMPAVLTEFRAILNTRTKLDLTNATYSRITVRVGVAPAANAKIKVQYSADETTWYDFCSVTMPATANLTNVGAWTAVNAGAKADVFIRLVGIDGNGAADPTFGLITLQIK